MTLIEQLQVTFERVFGRETAVIIRAPSCIDLLGNRHEDAITLSATIEPAVWLAAAPSNNQTVTIQAVDYNEQGQFVLPALEVQASSVVGPWLNEPLGVAWALQAQRHLLNGIDVLMVSDMAVGGGLGASAAVQMAFMLAWESVAGVALSDEQKARIGQVAEREYLGRISNGVGQLVCLLGDAKGVLEVDSRSLEHSLIPLPADRETAVLLVNSESKPQDMPLRADEVVAMFEKHRPAVQSLRDVTAEDLELFGHHFELSHRQQLMHIVGERARVAAGREALLKGDLAQLGRLMRQSHVSWRDQVAGSTPKLDCLAVTAWQTPGCYGAKLTQNGILLVLAEKPAVSSIQDALAGAFMAEHGHVPSMLATQFAPGAQIVMLS